MSNTRRALPSSPISQERYMSSPEYSELRGISGPAVTTKAELMNHSAKRSLLFFIQAMSLKPGGLRVFARQILEMFPERIGTATMHKTGIKPGRKYDARTASDVRLEMIADGSERWAVHLDSYGDTNDAGAVEVETLVKECRKELSRLPGFLIELCINPKLQFRAPGEDDTSLEMESMVISYREEEPESPPSSRDYEAQRQYKQWLEKKLEERGRPTYSKAEVPCFRDVVGALFEFQRRYSERARSEYVQTELGKIVFDALDFGLMPGKGKAKIIVLEGESRTGKTTSVEAWAEMHLGEARFISLSGITHKTGFFRAIARALGIGATYTRSSTEMQTRVEDVLQRSHLMLLIDEAHHLFSAAERVYSRPELIDWINTALYNHGVNSALICTPQFRLRMARVEKQTTWNSDQLQGRIKRFPDLPSRPTSNDIFAIARKLLPGACDNTIKYVAGYAMTNPLPFPALIDSIDEAFRLAQLAGRDEVKFQDMKTAIGDYTSKSANTLAKAFDSQILNKRKPRRRSPALDANSRIAAQDAPAPQPAQPRHNLTGLARARGVAPVLEAA